MAKFQAVGTEWAESPPSRGAVCVPGSLVPPRVPGTHCYSEMTWPRREVSEVCGWGPEARPGGRAAVLAGPWPLPPRSPQPGPRAHLPARLPSLCLESAPQGKKKANTKNLKTKQNPGRLLFKKQSKSLKSWAKEQPLSPTEPQAEQRSSARAAGHWSQRESGVPSGAGPGGWGALQRGDFCITARGPRPLCNPDSRSHCALGAHSLRSLWPNSIFRLRVLFFI